LNKLRRKACGEELTEEWRALTGGPGWRYAPNTWDPVAERLGLTCEVSWQKRERERWWWVGLVWSLKYILNWNQVSAVNLTPSKRYLPKLKQIGEKYCAAGFEVKNNFGYCNFPDLN
jgi:hypothetical protein